MSLPSVRVIHSSLNILLQPCGARFTAVVRCSDRYPYATARDVTCLPVQSSPSPTAPSQLSSRFRTRPSNRLYCLSLLHGRAVLYLLGYDFVGRFPLIGRSYTSSIYRVSIRPGVYSVTSHPRRSTGWWCDTW